MMRFGCIQFINRNVCITNSHSRASHTTCRTEWNYFLFHMTQLNCIQPNRNVYIGLYSIDNQCLAVKQAREQSGCAPKLLWLARLDSVCYRITRLLHSFTVSSCSCCIDPSVKMQEDPLQADWLS